MWVGVDLGAEVPKAELVWDRVVLFPQKPTNHDTYQIYTHRRTYVQCMYELTCLHTTNIGTYVYMYDARYARMLHFQVNFHYPIGKVY